LKSDFDYVKSNIGTKVDEIKDSYVLTVVRNKKITRLDALIRALEIHLNDIKEQLRKVETDV
jgi:hypothetical protein